MQNAKIVLFILILSYIMFFVMIINDIIKSQSAIPTRVDFSNE